MAQTNLSSSTGQVSVSQSPHLLVTVVPLLSTRVEHQGVGELSEVHLWYSLPLYLKGKTHLSPAKVRHRVGILLTILVWEKVMHDKRRRRMYTAMVT